MSEHILFLTGHLAEPRLRQVLASIGATPFTWEVRNVGVKVAALMTPEIIRRRLGPVGAATRIVLPGRCKGDLAALGHDLGVPVQLGPEEVKDLPELFGGKALGRDLTAHDCRIFAEIVEASALAVDEILRRAAVLRGEGADVIDLGCLPDTPFPQLEEAVRALQGGGLPGQRRFRRSRRAAPRRACRCRLPAQPDARTRWIWRTRRQRCRW